MGKNTFGILTINHLNIGINSAGDDLESVKKIERTQNECDIIIGCCRTKGILINFFIKIIPGVRAGWLSILILINFPQQILLSKNLGMT